MNGAVSRACVWVSLAMCGGCGDPSAAPPPPASSAAPAATVTGGAPPAESAAEEELSTRPVELLAFQFTSGVKDKQPVDRLMAAKKGDRVHAHLTLRNRSGRERTVHVLFRVNGEKRTEVDLKVGSSWSWRTWAYNTVLDRDKKGRIECEVTDDEGHPLVTEGLVIQ